METLDEKKESFIEQASPYIVGTDYGDGIRRMVRISLGYGFENGYQFAINKACEWWYIKLNALYPNDLMGDVVDDFRKAIEE